MVKKQEKEERQEESVDRNGVPPPYVSLSVSNPPPLLSLFLQLVVPEAAEAPLGPFNHPPSPNPNPSTSLPLTITSYPSLSHDQLTISRSLSLHLVLVVLAPRRAARY